MPRDGLATLCVSANRHINTMALRQFLALCFLAGRQNAISCQRMKRLPPARNFVDDFLVSSRNTTKSKVLRHILSVSMAVDRGCKIAGRCV